MILIVPFTCVPFAEASASSGIVTVIVGAVVSTVTVATTPGVVLPVPALSVAVADIDTVPSVEGKRLEISFTSQILKVGSEAARFITG